jgi:hypothetical protein
MLLYAVIVRPGAVAQTVQSDQHEGDYQDDSRKIGKIETREDMAPDRSRHLTNPTVRQLHVCLDWVLIRSIYPQLIAKRGEATS